MATVVAAGGKRVLLIDCDLRSPSVGLVTGLESTVGLSGVLAGRFTLTTAIQQWMPNLDVLTAGEIPPNPAQLLSSAEMKSLVERAKSDYDFVILDSAPLLAATDAVWLGHVTAGALVLARRGKVSGAKFAKALDILQTGRAPVLGVALTRVRGRHGFRYGRYGAYGKRSQQAVHI